MKRKSNSDGKNSKPLTVIKEIPSRNLSHLKVNNNTLRNVQFTALIPPRPGTAYPHATREVGRGDNIKPWSTGKRPCR